VLFVSHSMATVLNLCSRAILLRSGQLVYDGPAESTIKSYLEHQPEAHRDLTITPSDPATGHWPHGANSQPGQSTYLSSHRRETRVVRFRYKNITGGPGGKCLVLNHNQLGCREPVRFSLAMVLSSDWGAAACSLAIYLTFRSDRPVLRQCQAGGERRGGRFGSTCVGIQR
jgi:hypothetical protein